MGRKKRISRRKTLKKKKSVVLAHHLKKRNLLLLKFRQKRKRRKRKTDILSQAQAQAPNIKMIGTNTKARTRKLAHQDTPPSPVDIPGHPQGKKIGVKKTGKRIERRTTVLKKKKTEI